MYLPESSIPCCIATSRSTINVEVSNFGRWDIERDVIRGRSFDFSKRFLPEGLTRTRPLEFLRDKEQILLSQIQARTYANMVGLVERFIGAKMLEITRQHWFGDQTALEALVRFTDDELKHQALFRRIEEMIAPGMKVGYKFVPNPDVVARVVMGASTWAVLALTCLIERFTQVHYRTSLAPGSTLSELFQDVLLFHWRDESLHVVIDELEWTREDTRLTPRQRDTAVQDFIQLLSAMSTILQAQAHADKDYFLQTCGRALSADESMRVGRSLRDAYCWQYLVSGLQDPRFKQALNSKIKPGQSRRIQTALASLLA